MTTLVLDECEKYPGISLYMDADIEYAIPLSDNAKEGLKAAEMLRKLNSTQKRQTPLIITEPQ